MIIRLEDQGANFAAHTSIVGPQPGSPYPHFVVTQSDYGTVTPPPFGYLGRVLCFDAAPAGVHTYGRACAGSLPSTPTIGLRHLSPTIVRITVHGAAPNAPAVLLLGGSRTQWGPLPLPFPLGAIGLPLCDLLTSGELFLPSATGSAGTAAGYAALDLPVRLDAAGPCTLHAQWWCLPPAGLPGGVSNAVRWNAWL